MQKVCTHRLRTPLRIAVAVCGLVALSALAAQPASSNKSSRLAVSVTVVHTTGSPQAPVINMSCVNAGGEVKCRPRKSGDSAGAESSTGDFVKREEMYWF